MKYFSIIIPIYNAEKYLKESLDCILSQSFKDFELILVNDGSTDNSEKICQEYASKDSRVTVITTKNQGSGPARNEGIKRANGKFCYFPDGDDLLTENALEQIYEETQKQEADLYVFAFYQATRDNPKKILQERCNDFLDGDVVRNQYEIYMQTGKTYIQGAPWNKVFKTENIKQNHIEYPSLKRNQDEVFIVRYMNTVKNVKFCDIPIYIYFINDTKAEWNKFPSNYLDIRTEVYKEFVKNIIPWNKENKKVKYLIHFTYLETVLKCYEYMFSPKWNLNKKEKKQYIKNSLEREEVKKAITFWQENKDNIMQFLETDSNRSKKRIQLSFYSMKQMEKQNINTLYFVSKVMIQLRKINNKIKYGGKNK